MSVSKYAFSPAERNAVWVVHGEKCYLCTRMIDLASMHVDHVIPESLASEPSALAAALRELGLPEDFDVNSFANWMPACARCNQEKSDAVFKPSPLVQLRLQRAAEKAAEAAKLAQELVSARKVALAVNTIERVLEAGDLTDALAQRIASLMEHVAPLLVPHRVPERLGEPLQLAPGFGVVGERGGITYIRGPYGLGGRPSRPDAHSSFDCPSCGSAAGWNGARCVVCGMMDDD